MKYCMPVLVAFLLAVSCKQDKGGAVATADHLPPKTMEKVLYDIQLADVYSSSVVVDSVHRFGDKNIDSLAKYYNEVFKHHHITYEQFNNSIGWYKENPAQLDSIYTAVLNKFSAEGIKFQVQ